jgi:hypothetical protein
MKLTKQTLKRIIKEELEAVLEGSDIYISPDIQAALKKREALLNHPHPKIRALASDKYPDGSDKPYEVARREYNQAKSLADALGDY